MLMQTPPAQNNYRETDCVERAQYACFVPVAESTQYACLCPLPKEQLLAAPLPSRYMRKKNDLRLAG